MCSLSRLVASALALPVAAQSALVNHKLSGPMSAEVTSDVVDLSFSPDGERIAYTVVRSPEAFGSSGPTRLEVASSDGTGTPLSLTPEEPSISSFRWTPDGSRIVYTASETAGTMIKSVPADGSAEPTVLVPFGPSASVAGYFSSGDVALTADGSRVVFRHQTGEYPYVYRLASVPVTGGAPTLLNGALASGGDVLDFVVSGETVVYLADEVNGWSELYSVPADGSSARINITHIAAGSQSVVQGFVVDPSGTRAVYLAGNVQRLFSVPVDGSAPAVVLSPTLPFSRDVTSFLVSPDATRVVYRGIPASNHDELFVVPLDGSAPAESLVPDPGQSEDDDYRFSPDGAYLVYNIGSRYYSLRLSDRAVVQLFGSFALGWQIAPDSQRAVFLDWPREFYSARLDGTTPAVRINPDFAASGFVDNTADDDGFAISPDSQKVVFRADADLVGRLELYEVAIEPSGPPVATKLNPPVLAHGDAGAFVIAPSSTFVLYRAVLQTPYTYDLFRAPEDVAINDPLPAATAGDVNDFVVRNAHVVYRADQVTDGRMELFGAPADGSAAAVKLNGPLDGGNVWSFDLSPDGSTALYTADTEGTFTRNLFSVPSDGSGAPVQLNPQLTASHSVGGFLVVPDGSRVVYKARHEDTSGDRLYSVPIHGGSPVLLGMAPYAFDVECTPDSSRVVFNTTGDLYSAPVDGSAAAIDLSGSATSIGDFQLTRDGTRVLYMASRLNSIRLFSIPVEGGTRVELSGTLVSGGDVTGFALSADGERAVFLADRFVDERFLLSSVPADGGSPIVLNGPLVASGDVLDFQVSPAGGDVVYLADQEVDDSEWLHRVPVDGSAPAVVLLDQDLHGTDFAIAPDGANILLELQGLQVLPMAGGSLAQISTSSYYSFTPDGRHVVLEEAGPLMLVAIDGGASVRLSPDPVGSIRGHALDGERYVYRADQDVAGVVELYASWLQPIASTPLPPGRPVLR